VFILLLENVDLYRNVALQMAQTVIIVKGVWLLGGQVSPMGAKEIQPATVFLVKHFVATKAILMGLVFSIAQQRT